MNESPIWKKSSYSGPDRECVEVAETGDSVLVRDSKDPHGTHLRFTRGEWKAFLAGARDGEFD